MKKRRLLSIVLSLCMVLALMPQMVFAEEPGNYNELQGMMRDARYNGTVTLMKDYTINNTVTVYDTTLDLNGHVIKMTGNGSVIKVDNSSNFTLQDSSEGKTGVITSDTGSGPGFGGGVYVDELGSFTMNGGIIHDCYAQSGGGVFVRSGGSFTMNNGAISGCNAHVLGGGVCLDKGGSFTMNGGTIYNCSSPDGGVVYNWGTLYANGGTIRDSVYNRGLIENATTDGCTVFYGGINIVDSGTINGKKVTFKKDNSTYAVEIVKNGNKAAVPEAPTKEGYSFEGWYTDENKPYEFNSAVTENINLYAGFESLTYTVTYDSGEGEGSIEAGTKTHGENFILSSKTFTREGYIQTGWMDENGAEYDLGDTYTEDADVTLYPVWDKIVTLKVPFTTTVKLGGNVSPGETTFDLAVVDANADKESYKDVTAAGSVTTNGAGDYKGNMIFTGPSQQLRAMFCEGAFVQQVNAGEDGWTYDDTVWGLVWQDDIVALASADDATTEYSVNIFPAKYEKSENGIFYSINEGEKPVDNMRFQNTYTKSTTNPSDPEGTTNGDAENADKNAKTGDDTNLALWLALMLLSGAGITSTAVYTRRKRTKV